MEAGRELDALVAEKVMGGFVSDPDAMADRGDIWYWLHRKDGVLCGMPYKVGEMKRWDHQWHKWKPSTDIAAAWLVVERMAKLGYWCQVRNEFESHGGPDCWAGFTPHSTTGWNGKPDHWTQAETTPLAICLAALKAVEPS